MIDGRMPVFHNHTDAPRKHSLLRLFALLLSVGLALQEALVLLGSVKVTVALDALVEVLEELDTGQVMLLHLLHGLGLCIQRLVRVL